MKIPRYEQQVGAPSAPQFSQIADVRTNNLAGVADTLQGVYQDKLKEQEEAKKTGYLQADTSIKMALDQAMFDIQDRLQNGGSYANAEAEYQKAHEQAIKEFGGAFDADESGNVKLRSMAEYESYGLNNILKIRSAVSSRRKSDAVGSVNLRVAQAREEYVMAGSDKIKQEAAAKKITSALAGGASVGLYSGDEGKLKSMEALRDAEDSRLDYISIQYRNEPDKYLSEVESSKQILGSERYISHLARATADVDRLGTVTAVESYIANPITTRPPTQESVDLFYQERVAKPFSAGAIDGAQYEQSAIDASVMTGKLPTQIVMQSSSFLSMTPEIMTEADIATAASTARIVAQASKQGAKVNMNGLTKETIAKAELVTSRIESGMEERKAIQSVYADIGDDDRRKIYNSSADEARKILVNKKLGTDKFDVEIPQLSQSEFVDTFAQFRSAGSTPDEAVKLATKKINESYVKFDGIKVKDPATIYSRFDEDSWIGASKKYYESKVGPIPKGQKVAPIADRETRRLIASGEAPSFGLYLYVNEKEPPIAVFDKETGQPVRVYESPEMKSKPKPDIPVGSKEYYMRFK